MKKRILKNSAVLMLISILLTFVLMMFLLYNQTHQRMQEKIATEAQYIRYGLKTYGIEYLSEENAGIGVSRVTLIDTKGNVLYDSMGDTSVMENHNDRPEVSEAEKEGAGTSTRLSSTLGEETFYYALRLENGDILRVSQTTESVFSTLKSCIPPLFGIFFIVLLIAGILVQRQTERLVRPLNTLDLEQPLENEVYEELSPLLGRIHHQNQVIEYQIAELTEKQEEYEAITENMQDGLIVTDRSVILSINKKALELFQITKAECLHKNIMTLSRKPELKKCLEQALAGSPSNYTVQKSGRYYQILGNPVYMEGKVNGAVMFLLDVTDKTEGEKMRREFTANVSHELKTPLMSISGYAELIMNHMVQPEKLDEFAGRIFQEANRLGTLVADIIKLSKLDEQDGQAQLDEQVDLRSLAMQVQWQLQQKAAAKNVSLKIEGSEGKIMGNSQILTEIFTNLVDNAIKYNRENGSVFIRILPAGNHVCVEVEDTGIGIPNAERDRIFERFYRVDKSHSQEVEGTGLGLSIVKHGVLLHHGSVSIDSEMGRGSKITVCLPVSA